MTDVTTDKFEVKWDKKEVEEELQKLVDTFQCLKEWKIEVDLTSEYDCQISYSSDEKKAIIYRCEKFYGMPVDLAEYLFHELIHICLRDLRYTKESEQRGVEETFVRDMIKLYFDKNQEIERLRTMLKICLLELNPQTDSNCEMMDQASEMLGCGDFNTLSEEFYETKSDSDLKPMMEELRNG